MKFNFKRFFLVNLGVLILTLGLHYFLIPCDLVVGGATGASILIHGVLPNVPISIILFGLNIVLFILGFTLIGREFGGYTVYASFMVSGMLAVLEIVHPILEPLTSDILINLIFGIFIQGVGMGLVLNQGASTGGTDIIGKIVEKYTNQSFGTGLIFADGLITLGAVAVYGIELGLYALLGVIVNAVIVDKMLSGFATKYLIHINSIEWKKINNYILKELDRGTTIYVGEGGFSGKERKIVQVVLDKREWILLREYIRMNDSSAFMYVGNVSEVEGEGFTYE